MGVSYVLESYNKVIVLEDDIITSPIFLDFMNTFLNLYQHDEDVCQISGYSYLEQYRNKYQIPKHYFIKGADCLAWGTWKRAWLNYTPDSKALANIIEQKKMVNQFNRNGAYNFHLMLLQNASGLVNSWAINWYACNFLLNKYTLYPLKSLALHIGASSEATNYYCDGVEDPLNVNISTDRECLYRIPVIELEAVTKAYNSFLKKYKMNLLDRIKNRLFMILEFK
jgi:hypothetical protein